MQAYATYRTPLPWHIRDTITNQLEAVREIEDKIKGVLNTVNGILDNDHKQPLTPEFIRDRCEYLLVDEMTGLHDMLLSADVSEIGISDDVNGCLEDAAADLGRGRYNGSPDALTAVHIELKDALEALKESTGDLCAMDNAFTHAELAELYYTGLAL